MAKTTTTSAVIDNILRLTVVGGSIAVGILLPNLLVGLDKPLQKYLNQLDKRTRERELQRILSYMKSQRLVSGNYQHGLQITDKGRRRLVEADFNNLAIAKPQKWDNKWRLIIYDIPEDRKRSRDYLTAKLRKMGFYQLQRSAWIHPFPCRDVIEKVASAYKIDKYTTYIETSYVDNQKRLVKIFKKTLQ